MILILVFLLILVVITVLLIFYFKNKKSKNKDKNPKKDVSSLSSLKSDNTLCNPLSVNLYDPNHQKINSFNLYNGDCFTAAKIKNYINIKTMPSNSLPLDIKSFNNSSTYQYFVLCPVGPIKLGFSMPDINGNFGEPDKKFQNLGLTVTTVNDTTSQSYPFTYYVLGKTYDIGSYKNGDIHFFDLYAYNTVTKIIQIFRNVSRRVVNPGEMPEEARDMPTFGVEVHNKQGIGASIYPESEGAEGEIEFGGPMSNPSLFSQEIEEVHFFSEVDNSNTLIVNGYLKVYFQDTQASYFFIGPEVSTYETNDIISVNDVTVDAKHLINIYGEDNLDSGNGAVLRNAYSVLLVLLPNVELLGTSDSNVNIGVPRISSRTVTFNNKPLKVKLYYMKTPCSVIYKNIINGIVGNIKIGWGDKKFTIFSNNAGCTTTPDNIGSYFNNDIYYIIIGQPKYVCDGFPLLTDLWGATCDRSQGIPSSKGLCCPASFTQGSCYGCDPDGSNCVGSKKCDETCDGGKTCNTKYGLCEDENYQYAYTDKCCCNSVFADCSGDMSTPSLGNPSKNNHWQCPDINPSDPNQNLFYYNSFKSKDCGCFLSQGLIGECKRLKKK